MGHQVTFRPIDPRFKRPHTVFARGDEARQSDCVLVGCGDCRTLIMNEEREQLVALLRENGVTEEVLKRLWNRYVLPGGGVNLSLEFPNTALHREVVGFYVKHQLHGGEVVILMVHDGCGRVQICHPGMTFRRVVDLTIEAAHELHIELHATGRPVRVLVIADFLQVEGELGRYVLCADVPAVTPSQPPIKG